MQLTNIGWEVSTSFSILAGTIQIGFTLANRIPMGSVNLTIFNSFYSTMGSGKTALYWLNWSTVNQPTYMTGACLGWRFTGFFWTLHCLFMSNPVLNCHRWWFSDFLLRKVVFLVLIHCLLLNLMGIWFLFWNCYWNFLLVKQMYSWFLDVSIWDTWKLLTFTQRSHCCQVFSVAFLPGLGPFDHSTLSDSDPRVSSCRLTSLRLKLLLGPKPLHGGRKLVLRNMKQSNVALLVLNLKVSFDSLYTCSLLN